MPCPRSLLVGVFFILPLLLVGRMSRQRLVAAQRRPGHQLPRELHGSIGSNRLFWPAVVFTIEYTVLVTVLLDRPRAGPGAAGPGGQVAGSAACARSSCFPSRSAWPRRRCSSGASTRRPSGPSARCSRTMGLTSEPISVPGHAAHGAALDDVPHRLEVRRPVHAHPARGAPGHPAGGLRGRRGRRREPRARRSAASRCRSCGRRWRWRSSCASPGRCWPSTSSTS